jgi:DedD protein
MEKKKLLLVAVSVGVFLVIVIGAAILVFSPRNAVSAAGTAVAGTIPPGGPVMSGGSGGIPAETLPGLPTQPASVDPADMVRNPNGLPSLQPVPAQPEFNRENNFFVNSENERQPIAAAESPGTEGSDRIITVTRPTTAAVPDSPATGRSAPASGTASRPAAQSTPASTPAARTSTTARTSPAASGGSSTAASGSAASSARSSAAPTKSAPQRTPASSNYWVQTGSFSTQTRAEGAKEMLASKGITPIIENRDVDGKTFFRVRVGPYTSQNEADYWLSLIKSINGFENSQIWVSQSRP